MNKRLIYLCFSVILFMFFVTAAFNLDISKEKWESALSINTSGGNLQDIVIQNITRDSRASVLDGLRLNPGHNLGEIWVSVDGQEESLLDAMQNGLCGMVSPTTTYSGAPDPSHLGTEVEVTTPYDGQTKSLQDAINDGTLAKIDGNWSSPVWTSWSSCSTSCNSGTQTRTGTRTCTNPPPYCGGNDCGGSNTLTETRDCNVGQNDICLGTTGLHKKSDCNSTIGGTLKYDSINSAYYCYFSLKSCSGIGDGNWVQYLSWSATADNYCRGSARDGCSPHGCWTGYHSFSNTPRESCRFYNRERGGTWHTGSCRDTGSARTCYATILPEIGCI